VTWAREFQVNGALVLPPFSRRIMMHRRHSTGSNYEYSGMSQASLLSRFFKVIIALRTPKHSFSQAPYGTWLRRRTQNRLTKNGASSLLHLLHRDFSAKNLFMVSSKLKVSDISNGKLSRWNMMVNSGQKSIIWALFFVLLWAREFFYCVLVVRSRIQRCSTQSLIVRSIDWPLAGTNGRRR
jgi:hypothetical protein